MATRTRATNQDEFIQLIDEAIDEVEDLRASIEYDEAYTGEASMLVDPLSEGLTILLSSIRTGEYEQGKGDQLHFIEKLKDFDHRAIPFWPILRLILETHEQGYIVKTTDSELS